MQYHINSIVCRHLQNINCNSPVTGASQDGSQDGDDDDEADISLATSIESQHVRKDVLMGHLLALATMEGGAGLPTHSLPQLAGMLSRKGLLPTWVQWSLAHQPALFDRAFHKLFSEVGEVYGCSSGGPI